MKRVTLTHAKWVVELIPELGGSIALCRYDGQDLMRPALEGTAAAGEARDMSCYPLVPFSNRIENGMFEFGGRQVHLPRNMGDHPHAIHGQGWRGAWQLSAQDPAEAVLTYTHEADTWPWHYQATQTFTLSEHSFHIALAVTNLSDRPMPAGLGLHPYFPKSEGVTLTTGVTYLWRATNECIPIERIAVPQALDFARGLRIAELDLDDCFAGWNGKALIEWPGRPYRLWMEGDDNLRQLVVYTPPKADYFCVEGVENMNNAVNWLSHGAETGLTVLAPAGSPGSDHRIETVFRVEPVPA